MKYVAPVSAVTIGLLGMLGFTSSQQLFTGSETTQAPCTRFFTRIRRLSSSRLPVRISVRRLPYFSFLNMNTCHLDVRGLVLQISRHRAGVMPFELIGLQKTQCIQKIVVLLVPGLSSTVLSLPPLPTSATGPQSTYTQPIPTDPPPTTSSHSDLPTSIDPYSEEVTASFRSAHTARFPMHVLLAHLEMQHACTPSSTCFSRPARRK